MNSVLMLFAALAGGGIAFQVVFNTQLRVATGSPLWASAAQFVVGLGALTLVALALREPLPQTARGPWWMWIGGFFGATYIVVSVLLSRRLGTAVLLASTVVGQLLAALAIDHYGWLGAPVIRLSTTRVLGAALLIAGVLLMRTR
jgi:transporter family-2 protein